MTRPRKELVCLSETPYYHVVSRCVRRAFLCGLDRYSGRSFEHRRGWIQDRLGLLTQVFGIELCAYAVLSNHYHLVVRIDDARVTNWSPKDVVSRWQRLFSLPELVRRWEAGEALSPPHRAVVDRLIETWRERLQDLGWFMRAINEPIAREANREDKCTGRFWEGRYKSQALLDETALLTCMAYVDLNPIRADIASTPENSNFTSIQARIRRSTAHGLASFRSGFAACELNEIPYTFPDYLELVDWTGRALREDKTGTIDTTAQPILQRLNISAEAWLYTQRHYRARFYGAVGPIAALKRRGARLNQRWLCGLGGARYLYPPPQAV